ncbi:MAG: hypothetical protein OXU23_27440, partial [Candidatus Poribacteria bacterium]|nr:hypothetical protein [Candidatus Poribacteria bacterium]
MGIQLRCLVIVCLLLFGCQSDKPEVETSSQPINIVVILDISDRLLKEKLPGQERQVEKDKKIAQGIINRYEDFAHKTYYIGNRNRLT